MTTTQGGSPSDLIAETAKREAVERKRLERIALTLIAVVTGGRAQVLALDIVDALIRIFSAQPLGVLFDKALADADVLLDNAIVLRARGFVVHEKEAPRDLVLEADLLSSRLFARGVGATWPIEHRIPYEIANALRRACEPNVAALLPLLVRDARDLCAEAKVDASRIEAAIAKHGGTPS